MQYYIVTGASRGLGEAFVEEISHKDSTIICLSRSINSSLRQVAEQRESTIHFETCDLSDTSQVLIAIKSVLSTINFKVAEKIILVNNAGTINPIKKGGHANENDIISHVNLNLLAPMLMSEALIKEAEKNSVQTIIVNITSGAANRPIPGWSFYCSTKAGLNMYTQTVGAELLETKANITTIAFSPGIMDTEMQKAIRQAVEEQFSSLEQFKDFHEKGMLRSTSFVAKTLYNLLKLPLDNGRVYDIKEFI